MERQPFAHLRLVFTLLPILGLASIAQGAKKPANGVEFFEAKIRPVLVQHCYECHSAESKKVKGGLLLDSRDGLLKGGDSGAAVVPGDASASLLIEALKHEGLEMPPKGKLPEDVIEDFEKWIAIGMPDPRKGKSEQVQKKIDVEAARSFWAYQPPRAAEPPKVNDRAWPKSNLDRFILAQLEAKGLKPIGDADKLTMLRRVTFDLIGLPPTPKEIEAFLADDSPEALERVVDRLLESPQFGERWGRHWLDVARFGESTGKERNIPYAVAYKYRDWVIDAVNADMPYDQFIREQVAGDLLPAKTDAERDALTIATGFLALGPKSVNERSSELYAMDVVDEQIDVTCRAVLATTAACARCHDHKFDPIPTSDYYALAGIFRSTRVFAGVKRGSKDNERTSDYLTLAGVDPGEEPAREPSSKLDAEKVKQIEDMLAEIDRDFVKLRKQKDGGGDKSKFKREAKQLQEQREKLEKKLYGSSKGKEGATKSVAQLAMGAVDSDEPLNCHICIRGEVEDLGSEVPRGYLSVLTNKNTPKPSTDHSGRLELADWLVGRDNPLAARVLVNRTWSHLFGVGIVETIDNFGMMGEKPSHPELLDTLAVEFMDEGWSLKKLLRKIVLSRTYQLASDHSDANYAADPDNALLWRMNRRRLDAEAIRDAVLAASGELSLERPATSPLAKLGLGELGRNFNLPSSALQSNFRSVYLPMARGVVPEMLGVFDVADPSLVVGQREVTTVPTQALYMMNSPWIRKQSRETAARILDDRAKNDAARVAVAFRRILARDPSSDELARTVKFVNGFAAADSKDTAATKDMTEAWAAVCHVLYASAEFRYLY